MTDTERFDTLFQCIKVTEDKFGCPWMQKNAWFNTTSEGEIDMEALSGGTVTKDITDIDRILANNGLKLRFENRKPVID